VVRVQLGGAGTLATIHHSITSTRPGGGGCDFELLKRIDELRRARPWRHTLCLFGAYLDAKAIFGAGFAGTAGEGPVGRSVAATRFPCLIPNNGIRIAAGFDFKRSDTTLLAVGYAYSSRISTDVRAVCSLLHGTLAGRYGQTSVDGNCITAQAT